MTMLTMEQAEDIAYFHRIFDKFTEKMIKGFEADIIDLEEVGNKWYDPSYIDECLSSTFIRTRLVADGELFHDLEDLANTILYLWFVGVERDRFMKSEGFPYKEFQDLQVDNTSVYDMALRNLRFFITCAFFDIVEQGFSNWRNPKRINTLKFNLKSINKEIDLKDKKDASHTLISTFLYLCIIDHLTEVKDGLRSSTLNAEAVRLRTGNREIENITPSEMFHEEDDDEDEDDEMGIDWAFSNE